MSAHFCRLAVLAGLIALPSTCPAHRLDEYLQATLVAIEPGEVRLQINLTPGVEVAERVLARIDKDHNGTISTNEAEAYAESVKHDLSLALDRHKLALTLTASSFPEPSELRTGWGFIQLEFSATVGALSPGAHELTLANHHLRSLSVYLFNAAQPRCGSIQISRQTRNKSQSRGKVDFLFSPSPDRHATGS